MSTSECYVYLCNGHTYNVLPASSQVGRLTELFCYNTYYLLLEATQSKLPLMMLMFV